MIDLNEYKPILWDIRVKSRLIGLGKPYPTIRILVEEIVHIQCKIKEAKQLYESDKVKLLVERNYTARGIEELGYNTFVTILKNKLDEAYYALNKFRNVSSQIPGFGGQVNCILDYIMNGTRWVITEIRTNTIATRMDEENCISYIKEAEKLIGRKFV
jgi:hypothetical protein